MSLGARGHVLCLPGLLGFLGMFGGRVSRFRFVLVFFVFLIILLALLFIPLPLCLQGSSWLASNLGELRFSVTSVYSDRNGPMSLLYKLFCSVRGNCVQFR